MHRISVDLAPARAATLSAKGELDAFAAPELDEALASLSRADAVVLDLGAVSFMDSTALGIVVRTLREIDERGGKARVVLPKTSARRIFEITMLDEALPVADSLEEALADLAGDA